MFKILIVEDDKELSLLFQKVLEKSGYQVKSASDGAQALEVLDREYIDLIISDIIHFLRREMLDFTAFPVFFVSNLLLVQRKKYYFNRATVSRNCSIVL